MQNLKKNLLPSIRGVLLILVVLVGMPSTQNAMGQDGEDGFTELIATSQKKIVKVFGASAGRVEGYGTGIIVSNDGLIITSQGVYLDGPQVKIVTHDGREFVATILRRDRMLQLALLKIEDATSDYFALQRKPVGQKGDWILALSNAFRVADKDEPVSVMIGTISLSSFINAKLTPRDVAYRGEIVLIDAITSNPGAAGGAVVTLDGSLVGMIGKIINSSDTNTRLNYAVPSFLLADFVDGKIVETDAEATRPDVNMKPADLGIVLFKLGGSRNPAYIDRVVSGGAADQAGLKSDDLIIGIGGAKVGTVKEYEELIKELVPHEEVLVIVKRRTEILRVPVTPQEKQ